MTNEQIIKILLTEKECVMRNIDGCDRRCDKCDLILPDIEILNAYDSAIEIIRGM